ncbi:MAG TPA: YigZ family protein [Balneolales bacterium]|nr:YigZ family protein [Balneolales bacterium]
MNTFYTISGKTESELNEKNSKFRGFLFSCETIESFEQHLNEIKNDYPDATHHCYGYRIGLEHLTEYANDDGEPSGTAGLPILNKLKSFEVHNVGLVVVRYYGGTKLGKPGLIKAYGTSAEECLKIATLVKLVPVKKMTIQYPYSESNRIDQIINKYNCSINHSDYLSEVTYNINCPAENADQMFKELSHYEHLGIKSSLGDLMYAPSK